MQPQTAPAEAIAVEVSVTCNDWRQVPEAVELCREAVLSTLTYLGATCRALEVSVLLGDDATVQDLNRRYRHQDKPTNVLSFPGQEEGLAVCRQPSAGPPLILGDVVLAAGTVKAEAEALGRPISDHVRHLVVHGVLHLLGFDHPTDEEAERMEAVERFVLAGLGVPDPYAGEPATAVR